MGKLSREKGKRFEQEIARDFKKLGFTEACRHLEYYVGNGVDLENTGKFQVQCKRGKGYAPINKIFEIQSFTGIPVLITKADRLPTMAVIPWDQLMKILEDIGHAYEEVA